MDNRDFDLQTRTVTAGCRVVRATGDVIADNADRLRRSVAGELGVPAETVIVDLTGVTGIDAAGVDALYAAAEVAAEQDIGLCLVAPVRGVVMTALTAGGSAEVFELAGTLAEALRRCS